ncbi:MAG TPA: hypothetical protein EYP01_00565 [Candidatus Poseidoniales archaeon]|nr:hypothetical protein [Candidatus Poseidoniales archaeon]
MVELGFSGVAVFMATYLLLGERSIDESFVGGSILANMAYVKVFLVGCLILLSLKYNARGILPEVPVRPPRPTEGDAE